MSELNDWSRLSKHEKEFCLRCNGTKYSAEPHYHEPNGEWHEGNSDYLSVALWENPEKLGFIECVGSYKWIKTSKLTSLFSIEVIDQLTTITKQRDELVEVLESAGKEIYMLINEVNKLRMTQVNSTTETPPDLHDMETCHVIGKLLSTIKEQEDAE